MNAKMPTVAAVPESIRGAFHELDNLLGLIKDAAEVFDTLIIMERADIAFLATNPIHGKAKQAREVLYSVWDEAMGKEVAA